MAQIDYTWWCDASLPEHPKVHRLAEALRLSDLEAIGVIASLFCRVRRHAPSGDLSAIPERTLALWGGHKRVTLAALTEAGWIDSDKRIHGWSERYAEADAKRQRDIDRKRDLRRGNGAGTAPPRRARGADETAPRAWNGAAAARNGAGEGKGDGEGDDGKGSETSATVGEFSGAPPTAPSALASLPLFFEKIFRGKSARTNNLRRSDELRTALGEGLARYAGRVAEAIVARAAIANNPESYVTSAVRKPWVRDMAAAIESAEADARELASRPVEPQQAAPRAGGASAIALKELLDMIPGGGA